MACGACGKHFQGTGPELRDLVWPHYDTHDETEFKRDREGGTIAFIGDEVVLSCNCGECEFCLSKTNEGVS